MIANKIKVGMIKWFVMEDKEAMCGESSQCINRQLNMECSNSECQMGDFCLNKRYFTTRLFILGSRIVLMRRLKSSWRIEKDSVYALHRTSNGLIISYWFIERGRFVIEYCGEVIPQKIFLKRTLEYSESGVEHFYFMSLQSNEVHLLETFN